MQIHWLRWDKRLPVAIDIATDDGEMVSQLCRRLIKDNLEAVHVPPRGQRILVINEDAVALGMPGNPQATAILGRQVAGDAVIISPDVWASLGDF